MSIRIYIFTTILAFSAMTKAFGQSDNLRKEISKIIKYDTGIEYNKTPGFIVGLIDHDSIYVLPFGNVEFGSEEILARGANFELGGTSKVFMASLVSILEGKDLLSFDKKYNELLPQKYRNSLLNELTIGNLLNHSSGMPKLPDSFGTFQKDILDPYKGYSKRDLIEFYSNYVPKRKTNKGTGRYSHVNYALLEIGLENHFQTSYQQLLKENLFYPLNMYNSFVIDADQSTTPGYNRAGNKVKPWSFDSFAASEGIKSSINDLLHFIKANLDSSNPLYHYLSATHNIETGASINDYLFMGKGWHIVKGRSHKNIISHTGKTGGHQSFIAFIKETKTAVIVLSNSAHGVEDLGFLILRMINQNWRRKE